MKTKFSTINESDLHNSLKNIYCDLYDGQTEVEEYGHVYDIVTKNQNVIEIQTKNLSKLLPKIVDTIEKGRNVKIIHPVVAENKIELKDLNGNLIYSRKSPKKENVYSIFKELTGIYEILLNPRFSLEIVRIKMVEERTRTAENVQSQNNKRRFKKNWLKTNKRLESVIATTRFNSKEDWLSLLPELPEIFCAKHLEEKIGKKNNPHLILWVFARMKIIELDHTKNRVKFYKISR